MQFPIGYRFHPADSELLGFYLYNRIFQPNLLPGNTNPIPYFDLYGSHEPSHIWTLFGGDSLLEDDPSLFFFTTLKKKSSKGRRICRTVGSGTWSGEDSGETIQIGDGNLVGLKKRFRYENPSSSQDRAWIMHEYSFDSSNTVVCRLKKNNKSTVEQRKVRGDKKRKSKTTEEHVEDSEVFVQPKRPRTEHCSTLMLESQQTCQLEEEALGFCFKDDEEKELLMKLVEDLPSLLATTSHSGHLLDSFAGAVTVGTEENTAAQFLDSFPDVVALETKENTTESSSYSSTIPIVIDGVADDDGSWVVVDGVADDDGFWWADIITVDDLTGVDLLDVTIPAQPTLANR